MNRQQILHEQAALTQKQKEITPREYVSEMTRLRSELSIAEKKICDDYDRVVAENKIFKEKSLSAIELNEAMFPKSYLRISQRFPDLTMKEIIEVDKKARDNGGSIKMHGGDWTHNNFGYGRIKIGWSCCISLEGNSVPHEMCQTPKIFYLKDELQDIKGIKVSDVSTAISSNIILLESAIQEYSIKIDKLKKLQTTLDCLV